MVGEKLGAAAGFGGAGTAVAAGLNTSQADAFVVPVFGLTPATWSVIGVIGGIVIGLLGVAVNAYFAWSRRRDEREARMKR